MRRVLVLAVTACGLLTIGAVASQARSEHHHRHHGRHHVRHHDRRFGDIPGAPGTTGTPPASGTTIPNAGTVTSFTGGVLTITLANGTTVSGMVTADTRIDCVRANDPNDPNDPMGDNSRRDGGPGPSGSGDNGGQNGQGDGNGDNNGRGDDNGQGDDNDPGDDNMQACQTTALVAGATVRDAELSISQFGATWERVDLG
jgi:hypothetical protein